MSCKAAEIFGLHATHSEDRTGDCLLVGEWDVITCQDDVGENQTRVRGVWPDLSLATLVKGGVDPLSHHHRDHQCHSLIILWEVDRIGNNVGALRDRDRAVLTKINDFGAILLDSLFQLDFMC